jgi:hypothetical protein
MGNTGRVIMNENIFYVGLFLVLLTSVVGCNNNAIEQESANIKQEPVLTNEQQIEKGYKLFGDHVGGVAATRIIDSIGVDRFVKRFGKDSLEAFNVVTNAYNACYYPIIRHFDPKQATDITINAMRVIKGEESDRYGLIESTIKCANTKLKYIQMSNKT